MGYCAKSIKTCFPARVISFFKKDKALKLKSNRLRVRYFWYSEGVVNYFDPQNITYVSLIKKHNSKTRADFFMK